MWYERVIIVLGMVLAFGLTHSAHSGDLKVPHYLNYYTTTDDSGTADPVIFQIKSIDQNTQSPRSLIFNFVKGEDSVIVTFADLEFASYLREYLENSIHSHHITFNLRKLHEGTLEVTSLVLKDRAGSSVDILMSYLLPKFREKFKRLLWLNLQSSSCENLKQIDTWFKNLKVEGWEDRISLNGNSADLSLTPSLLLKLLAADAPISPKSLFKKKRLKTLKMCIASILSEIKSFEAARYTLSHPHQKTGTDKLRIIAFENCNRTSSSFCRGSFSPISEANLDFESMLRLERPKNPVARTLSALVLSED